MLASYTHTHSSSLAKTPTRQLRSKSRLYTGDDVITGRGELLPWIQANGDKQTAAGNKFCWFTMADQRDGGDLQEVVMERDGKFEVVSAVDLHAEQEVREEEQQPYKQQQQQQQQQQEDTVKLATRPAQGADSGEETEHQEGNVAATAEGDQTSATPTTDSPPVVQQDRVPGSVRDTQASQENKEEESSKSTSYPKLDPSTCPVGSSVKDARKADDTPPMVGDLVHKSELKQKQQIRMQSAPGVRTGKSARLKRESEEERERRRKMSEAAFAAWVARKEDERRTHERDKSKSGPTAEGEREKRGMCERVYKNWMDSKNQQLKSQRMLSRPSTSVPKKDEEQCRRAFESWLDRKRTQHLEDAKRERLQTQEIAESAGKADPSITDTVYKE